MTDQKYQFPQLFKTGSRRYDAFCNSRQVRIMEQRKILHGETWSVLKNIQDSLPFFLPEALSTVSAYAATFRNSFPLMLIFWI